MLRAASVRPVALRAAPLRRPAHRRRRARPGPRPATGLDAAVADLASGRGGDAAGRLVPYGVRFVLLTPPVDRRSGPRDRRGPRRAAAVSGQSGAVLWRITYPSARVRLLPPGAPVVRADGSPPPARVVPAGQVEAHADIPAGAPDRLLVAGRRRGRRLARDAGRPLARPWPLRRLGAGLPGAGARPARSRSRTTRASGPRCSGCSSDCCSSWWFSRCRRPARTLERGPRRGRRPGRPGRVRGPAGGGGARDRAQRTGPPQAAPPGHRPRRGGARAARRRRRGRPDLGSGCRSGTRRHDRHVRSPRRVDGPHRGRRPGRRGVPRPRRRQPHRDPAQSRGPWRRPRPPAAGRTPPVPGHARLTGLHGSATRSTWSHPRRGRSWPQRTPVRLWPAARGRRPLAWPPACSPAARVDAMRGLAGHRLRGAGHRLLVRRQRRGRRAARPGLPDQPRVGTGRRRRHALRARRPDRRARGPRRSRLPPARRRCRCSTRWHRASTVFAVHVHVRSGRIAAAVRDQQVVGPDAAGRRLAAAGRRTGPPPAGAGRAVRCRRAAAAGRGARGLRRDRQGPAGRRVAAPFAPSGPRRHRGRGRLGERRRPGSVRRRGDAVAVELDVRRTRHRRGARPGQRRRQRGRGRRLHRRRARRCARATPGVVPEARTRPVSPSTLLLAAPAGAAHGRAVASCRRPPGPPRELTVPAGSQVAGRPGDRSSTDASFAVTVRRCPGPGRSGRPRGQPRRTPPGRCSRPSRCVPGRYTVRVPRVVADLSTGLRAPG